MKGCILLCVLLWGCGGGSAAPPPDHRPASLPSPSPQAPQPETGDGPLVVFLGDSLTAGYGLAEEEAFPARIAARLGERGRAVRVVNAGVSGDTTAGGLRRLAWVLRQRPDVLVVSLGANDGLRGQPVEGIEDNLRQIVEQATAAGCRVLLVGMRVPPSLGPIYSEAFAAIYPRLARQLGVPLMPFLLQGVGGDPELNLPDGIHPTARGHQRLADSLLPHLEPLLDEPPG